MLEFTLVFGEKRMDQAFHSNFDKDLPTSECSWKFDETDGVEEDAQNGTTSMY